MLKVKISFLYLTYVLLNCLHGCCSCSQFSSFFCETHRTVRSFNEKKLNVIIGFEGSGLKFRPVKVMIELVLLYRKKKKSTGGPRYSLF